MLSPAGSYTGSPVDLELAGKVALVTGSSRGIGRAIALGLAREGVSVVLAARGADDLEGAVAEASALGTATGVVADVTTGEGAAAVVAAAVDRFGGIDIVVNNVGGSGPRTLAETEGADLAAAASAQRRLRASTSPRPRFRSCATAAAA